jgi:signal transduction histidine kinase/DNA-binding response OmpR family regulator
MKKNNKISIVIAEDSPTQAEQLKYLLESEGYEVHHGKDGRLALDIIRSVKPQMVISDIIMPEMDGFELCQEIKQCEDLKSIPVILLTSLDDPGDIIKGLECGADNYFTKPFNPKYLIERVRTMLNNSELRQFNYSMIDLEIFFSGSKYKISSDRLQILDLLLSTFEISIQKNEELHELNEELTAAKNELARLNRELEKKVEDKTARLEHLNRILRSIRNVNQLIVKEKRPGQLIQKTCTLLTQQRGYETAWISLVSENGKWNTTAGSGMGKNFPVYRKQLKDGNISACCQKAFKTSGVLPLRRSDLECGDCPLLESGCDQKMILSRLEYEGKIYGTLVVTLPEEIDIDKDELSLFNEVAGDLGFALHDIEMSGDLKKTNIELQKQTQALDERLKEINCLYSIDETLAFIGINEREIFNEITALIQANWQFPKITAVRIIIRDQVYQTNNFKETKWFLSSDIQKDNIKEGRVEIFYLGKMDESFSGPFREQEIMLLENITNKIQRYLQQTSAVEQIFHAVEKAENADKLKSAFLMNMSHEIRTPMNAIIGFSDLLSKNRITPDQRDSYIRMIQTSGDRLMHLIDDILDISKIESGLLKIESSACSVNKLIKELHVSFESQKVNMGKGSIELKTGRMNADELMITTDPYRLRQVLSNLIDNALKYTEKGSVEIGYLLKPSGKTKTQTLRSGVAPDFLEFYVRDTGIGIEADQLDIVFDRFMKIEDKMKLYGGAGLGLTISRNLVRMLGGDIWIDSEPGRGSTFFFTIPFAKGESVTKDDPPANTESKKPDWKDKTILVVEDEESNYILLEYGLEETGVNLIRAINGEDGVDKCHKIDTIDLVLMDVKMPVMDGYTATRLIKKFRKELPIIAVTAFAMEKDIQQSLQAGCDDYFSKPINFDELLPRLNKHLFKKISL